MEGGTEPMQSYCLTRSVRSVESCVLADRVRRLRRIPGVAAAVYTELLLVIEDLEGFLAKTENLQLLSSLLLHGRDGRGFLLLM